MFFAVNVYGSARLSDAYDTLPIPADKKLRTVAKFLGISERTLSNYLTGKSDPPRALVYAIWHESPMGRAVTSQHSEHGALLQRLLAQSLQQSLDAKDKIISALSEELAQAKMAAPRPMPMNDPVFSYR